MTRCHSALTGPHGSIVADALSLCFHVACGLEVDALSLPARFGTLSVEFRIGASKLTRCHSASHEVFGSKLTRCHSPFAVELFRIGAAC